MEDSTEHVSTQVRLKAKKNARLQSPPEVEKPLAKRGDSLADLLVLRQEFKKLKLQVRTHVFNCCEVRVV